MDHRSVLRTTTLGLVGLVAVVALAPGAAAHPFATPFDNPLNGRRCYYYDDHDTNTRQIWVETNGVTVGGEVEAQQWFGLPPLLGSGLQRFATDEVPADTLLDPIGAALNCSI